VWAVAKPSTQFDTKPFAVTPSLPMHAPLPLPGVGATSKIGVVGPATAAGFGATVGLSLHAANHPAAPMNKHVRKSLRLIVYLSLLTPGRGTARAVVLSLRRQLGCLGSETLGFADRPHGRGAFVGRCPARYIAAAAREHVLQMLRAVNDST